MPTIRVLSRTDVMQAVPMPLAIDLMREAFAMLSAGEVSVPVRTSLSMEELGSRALYMPAYSASAARVSLKVVVLNPANPSQGLPFIHALVMISDASTGEPLAIMDGEYLTALRTGAGSGIATQLLSRRDASVAAIFGAGVQARTQLQAVAAVRSLEKAYVFGRSRQNAELFASEMSARLGVEVVVAHDPACLQEADIVCTSTTSLTPVFDASDLKPGCHINGIGSYRPDMTEIPAEAIQRSRLFVDQREAVLAEAGDILIPLSHGLIDEDHIAAEIGEVINCKKAGRIFNDEITVFKSVGNAVQDLVVAQHLAAIAIEQGLGTQAEL